MFIYKKPPLHSILFSSINMNMTAFCLSVVRLIIFLGFVDDGVSCFYVSTPAENMKTWSRLNRLNRLIGCKILSE